MHPDIKALEEQFEAVARDYASLVDGLDERTGGWRPDAASWSVAECLDHLATANRAYLDEMTPAAAAARAQGRTRRGPATPGFFGRLFAYTLDAPPKAWSKSRAPKLINPRQAPPFGHASAAFARAHEDVRRFLRENADLDLAGITYVNPLARRLRPSLATGLHVIAAHERRHLWQAWNVRRAVN
jgi:DinB superfamily